MAANPIASPLMKKALILGLALLACSLTACQKQAAARAERSKPRVEITSMNVLLRRAPAANAQISPDGTLKVDDIELPQPPERRAKLQLLFGHLQMLRQQALADAAPDPNNAGIVVQPTAQIQTLEAELLQEIPSLLPYRESFGSIKAERR
jgi:hypothetical protein